MLMPICNIHPESSSVTRVILFGDNHVASNCQLAKLPRASGLSTPYLLSDRLAQEGK
jgi:hypothetical protein